jgi:hypothetical protein
MLWIALVTAALARDCPWPDGIQTATAKANTVTINAVTYPVSGTGKDELAAGFRACGVDGTAAMYLNEWRRQRRNAFITGGLGLVLWPIWIATTFQASAATQNRNAMIGVLLTE